MGSRNCCTFASEKTNITMKKLTIIAMSMLLCVASSWARPALKNIVNVKQADGTTLAVCLQGDEYVHWNTTADGYAVVKDKSGSYVYATNKDGKLQPTSLLAHDETARSAEEKTFIAQTGKLMPEMNVAMKQMKTQEQTSRQRMRQAMKAGRYDYANFKGLVLLVEYNDCKFQYDNYRDIMDAMINQDNYAGNEFTNCKDPYTNQTITCTGSMRDYFRDGSNGMFVPTFDVVGPVTVDHSQYFDEDVQSEEEATRILLGVMTAACKAADDQVDFSQYDVDHDGVLDMVYLVFAGLPSYIAGNNEDLLWPHQADMSYMRKYLDGVRLARYACSTELFGIEAEKWSVLEGIGTMCHEFSHVLGLPDFYDANYEKDGQSIHPGGWSVMADGADYEYGRRPCAYSLFERYALGFATPQVISQPGTYELDELNQSNTGYRINTPQKNEFFMLENRQAVKWDALLPGKGMLVHRVDSTDAWVWQWNEVNNSPKHNYYELLRATGYRGMDTGYDPFPGLSGVTVLDNETSPANLLTWEGKYSPFGLQNIVEENGVVKFDVFDATLLANVSLPSNVSLGVGTSLQLKPQCRPSYVEGSYVWVSSDESVVTVSTDGRLVGVGEGEAEITLTANETLTAKCVVKVRNLPIVEGVAAMRQQADGTEALLTLTNAQVLVVNGKDIYMRETTGSIILRNMDLTVAVGDVLNGSIYGQFNYVNRMPVLTAVDGISDPNGVLANKGDEAAPVSLHTSQLSEEYYADMVLVKKAQLERASNGVFVVLGDKRYRLYNTLKVKNVKVPTDYSKRYDVTAIFGTNTLGGEVIDELYLLKSPEQVDYTALEAIELPTSMQLTPGREVQLEPTLTPAKADVFLKWTTSNEKVATVTENGLLTAVADGTATITVTNMDNGVQATCQIMVGEAAVIDNIAAFKTQDLNSEAMLTLTNAQVLYVHKGDAYVRDASGAIRFNDTGLTLNVGDELNGRVFGHLAVDGLVPQLLGVPGLTNAEGFSVTPGVEILPREVSLDELSEADLADLIELKTVQMETIDGLAGIYVTDGSKHIRLYNDFQLKNLVMPKHYEDRYYDITGILLSAVVADQTVYNLALLISPKEVDALVIDGVADVSLQGSTPLAVYTSDGRLLMETTKAQLQQLSLPRGLYVVKCADRVIKIVKR